MKVHCLGIRSSSVRDAAWYLVQKDDGSLHVQYESEDPQDGEKTGWEKPLNEFLMTEISSLRNTVQELIDRMFEQRDRGRASTSPTSLK
ncbi:hypothetical protein MKK88_10305 [Methylobacterium sp. E-005]|uniref:hypothetical protein n=1 Tax=Methylobacterium sp. E-005 TaxID=2836549 RepID=UPI001FB9D4E7|nr:hypothetical protein [Methylobacterium sp. E-005]MCJ2086382.1 hypothetical protein [Methylobacterium sp. E-005]